MFFFDNASTTQCNPLAVDVMAKYLIRDYANPSSIHHMGAEVASDIDSVKKVVLEKINASQGDVVFTSGGTEANNLAILGTAAYLKENGIQAKIVEKIWEGKDSILDLIQSGKLNFVINTPTKGKQSGRDGFKIRRMAVECKIPCFTSLDTVNALYKAIEKETKEEDLAVVDITKI